MIIKIKKNILEIGRGIPYAKIKYISGWMWTDVTREFGGENLSRSPRIYGSFNEEARWKHFVVLPVSRINLFLLPIFYRRPIQ